MPNKKELYHFTHSSPEIETVADLLESNSSPAFMYFNKPERFLAIVGEDKLTNRQRIESMYLLPEEKIYIGAGWSKLPLMVGTILYLESEQVNQPSFLTEGINVVSNNEPAFKAAKLAELEADKGYISINKPIEGQIIKGGYQEMLPDVTVWIWCRALSTKDSESSELKGEFFDLTPFIENVTTNMTKNGGNFQLKLPPLMCVQDKDNKWTLVKASLDQYVNKNGASLQGTGYVAHSTMFTPVADEPLVRSKFLFHNMISANDLVLIRMETLEMEKEQRYSDANEYYVSKKNIAGRIYDMIGLVDTNTMVTTPASNDVSISVTGRDLAKIFIEDGTYFYALENSQGMLKFAGQSTQKNSLTNRIFADNGMAFIGLYQFTSIEYILKFVIQQLSNIKILPNDLFESYGDRRNNTYTDIGNTDTSGTKFKKELAPGIWQIIDLVIDKSVGNRRLADSSFSTANGSLLNFIRSACQEPLVEFFMDTYGDKYNLIVRRPPYDQKGLISLIEGKVNTETGKTETPPAIVTILQDDVIRESLAYDDSQVYSWYHFFPRNAMIGSAGQYSLSYLGALYFPEYADIWGSKPFQQSHSYIPYVPIKQKQDLGLDEAQAVEDLKYVVESSQYLPFTRKGTLVLNRDRRLKIGNIFRYESTGEIGFITGVQHTFQISEGGIEATTTIQVERMMIEQLIYGQYMNSDNGDDPKFVSYFNIINTNLVYNKKAVKVEEIRTVKKSKSVRMAAREIVHNQILQNGNEGMGYLDHYDQYPENKTLFITFINEINKLGYKVRLTPLATNRTYAQQAALKRQNSNNADPGHSRHESGGAIDITIINFKDPKDRHSKSTSEAGWRKTGVPSLANSLGLRWGGKGNDGTFGAYVDRVHFEVATIISRLDNLTENEEHENITETITKMTTDREGIFQNFKVNKFSFNFFLKRMQAGEDFRKVTSRLVYDNGGALLEEVRVIATKKR